VDKGEFPQAVEGCDNRGRDAGAFSSRWAGQAVDNFEQLFGIFSGPYFALFCPKPDFGFDKKAVPYMGVSNSNN
jgi:hypothetical protein